MGWIVVIKGRIIKLITGLLQNPYSLLPRSVLFPIIDPTHPHTTSYHPFNNNNDNGLAHPDGGSKLNVDDGHESMKSNFALARMLGRSAL
jgi:hypothetical protein